jgi:hypothetical protein
VQVSDQEETLVGILQTHPVIDRSHQVPDMARPGRTMTGENPPLGGWFACVHTASFHNQMVGLAFFRLYILCWWITILRGGRTPFTHTAF